jgi:putative membrane protein
MAATTKILLSAGIVVSVISMRMSAAPEVSSSDRQFLEEAAKGSMEEVHYGRMAMQNGATAGVKAFGQKMVTDHTKANQEAAQLAQQKGVTLPPQSQIKMNPSFANKTGADFDKAYVADMISDHEKDVAAFEKEANSGTDPDIKAWAAKMLPTLRQHLTDARALKSDQ